MNVTVALAIPTGTADAADQEKRKGVVAGSPEARGEVDCRRTAPSTGRKFCRFGQGLSQLLQSFQAPLRAGWKDLNNIVKAGRGALVSPASSL